MPGALPDETMQLITQLPAAEIQTRMEAFVVNTGGQKILHLPQGISARYGSMLRARLWGAVGGMESFPRELRIEWKPTGDKNEITITLSDKFGFGSRLGMKSDIKALYYKQMHLIAAHFTDAEITKEPSLF